MSKKRYKVEVELSYVVEYEIDYDKLTTEWVEAYNSSIGGLDSPEDLIRQLVYIHRQFGVGDWIEGIGVVPRIVPASINDMFKRLDSLPYKKEAIGVTDEYVQPITTIQHNNPDDNNTYVSILQGDDDLPWDDWPWHTDNSKL